MVDRNKNLNVRVSDEEMRMLAALAEAEGVSQSDYVRLRIRRDYAAAFGAAAAKPAKKAAR